MDLTGVCGHHQAGTGLLVALHTVGSSDMLVRREWYVSKNSAIATFIRGWDGKSSFGLKRVQRNRQAFMWVSWDRRNNRIILSESFCCGHSQQTIWNYTSFKLENNNDPNPDIPHICLCFFSFYLFFFRFSWLSQSCWLFLVGCLKHGCSYISDWIWTHF